MMRSDEKKRIGWKEAVRRTCWSWKLWWRISPAVFLSRIAASSAKAMTPYIILWMSAQILDELSGARNPQTLWKLTAAALLAAGMLTLLTAALKRWVTVQAEAEEYLDDKLYTDKMLDLDFQDMDRQSTYELFSRLHDTVQWTGWGTLLTPVWFEQLVTAAVRIMGGIFLSIGMFTVQVPETGGWISFLNRPVFMAASFFLLLAASLLPPFLAEQGQKCWSRAAEDWSFSNRFGMFFGVHVNEERRRALDMRIYRQQEQVCDSYLAREASFSSVFERIARGPVGLWMAASQAVSAMLTGLIYLLVCLKAWAGAFGIGSVTQYVGAVANLFLGVSELLQVLGTLRTNAEFLDDNLDFLNMPNSMYRGSLTTEKRSDRQYEIEFKDVSFRYPGTDKWVLRHVSLKFRIGCRMAIVGENGSGKTTFIKLLCRLYDPDEGQIFLNGIDIRKYRYSEYMKILAVVFQDYQLFSLPLGQNVAGSAKFSSAAVTDCLAMSGFGDRLSLDTFLYKDLNQEGVNVSGGEAQKIAIARALYKDAAFLILDEPTAALDPVTEAEIYSQLDEIAGDRTAIFISHRLSSCRFCEEITVFDNGRIVQQGSHDKLLADTDGKYYELWNAQAQYYRE